MGLFYVTEGTWLLGQILQTLLSIARDRVFGSTLPVSTAELTSTVMARLLDKKQSLAEVRADASMADRPIEEVGAGGTGTSRAWYVNGLTVGKGGRSLYWKGFISLSLSLSLSFCFLSPIS